MIRPENNPKFGTVFRVYCDFCPTSKSSAIDIDPGDVALKAKKERFVTVPGKEIHDPMKWCCKSCAGVLLSVA